MTRMAPKPSGLTDAEKIAKARRWASGWRPAATKIFRCSICDRSSRGYGAVPGNNAWPVVVNDGRCCDSCNENVVLPARFALVAAAMADAH